MLREINYVEPKANLGKIVRKNLTKEWSYFFDCLIKVFTEKISNFDAITQVVQEISYGVLYDDFHNHGETILRRNRGLSLPIKNLGLRIYIFLAFSCC